MSSSVRVEGLRYAPKTSAAANHPAEHRQRVARVAGEAERVVVREQADGREGEDPERVRERQQARLRGGRDAELHRRHATWIAPGHPALVARIAYVRRVAVLLGLASRRRGAARADGLPVLGIDVGGSGVVAPSGEERYATVPAGDGTVVARVGTSDGRIAASRVLAGALTIPAVAYDGSASGLSGDGRKLVLIQPRVSFPASAPASRCSTRAASSAPGGSTCAATSASTRSRRAAGSST